MILKKQITKQALATSVTLAILGVNVTPSINVLSAYAAEQVQTAVATTESELINKDTGLLNQRFKNFTILGEYTNTPQPATGFELTGTDPNRYELKGQNHRMVAKDNPFNYYLHETQKISETAGFTAVTISTEVGKSYIFDYTYRLSNSYASTANASSHLSLEVGVSQYGGDKIKFNTYMLPGRSDITVSDRSQIEFKAISTSTIVYIRAGYTSMNTLGAQHYASLESYSVKAAHNEASAQEVATNAVKALFNNNDVTGTIKSSLTQNAIDNAKELVAAVTNAAKKAELTTQIAEAQKQLDVRIAENQA
uniref:toxin Cry1Ac domain D-VI-related protein n=1 Tax=Listeria rocourtiae TaxID=647910 RepID=UPI003D2F6F65